MDGTTTNSTYIHHQSSSHHPLLLVFFSMIDVVLISVFTSIAMGYIVNIAKVITEVVRSFFFVYIHIQKQYNEELYSELSRHVMARKISSENQSRSNLSKLLPTSYVWYGCGVNAVVRFDMESDYSYRNPDKNTGTIHLYLLGWWNVRQRVNRLRECCCIADGVKCNQISLHHIGRDGYAIFSKEIRYSSTNYLPISDAPYTDFIPFNLHKSLCIEVDVFLKSKDDYLRNNIPYRRNLMLLGPPGTGKTSTVLSLAKRFKMDIYLLTDYTNMFDNTSKHFNNSGIDPNPCGKQPAFLLIDDIDKFISTRTNCSSSSSSSPSSNDDGGDDSADTTTKPFDISPLLHILDGIGAPENMIIVMTANDIDCIPDVLMRYGRVHRLFKFPCIGIEVFDRIVATTNASSVEYEQFDPTKNTLADVLEACDQELFSNLVINPADENAGNDNYHLVVDEKKNK